MLNSEIRKYYWQEFSFQRIIAMPAVLLVIVLMIFLGNNYRGLEYGYKAYVSAIETMTMAFFAIVIFWGGAKAANSISEEVCNNTWDNQRLSSVSPWQLALGKLFGSTLYNWYGGAIILFLYICLSFGLLRFLNSPDSTLVAASFTMSDILFNVLNLIIGSILCHAIAMASSIQLVKTGNRRQRANSASSMILAVLIVMPIIYGQIDQKLYYSIKYQPYTPAEIIIDWFWLNISAKYLTYLSLCIFTAWTLIAIYRFIREELKYRNIPWVWGAFIIFIMIYVSGFIYEQPSKQTSKFYYPLVQLSSHHMAICFGIGIFSTYLVLFADTLSLTRYRMIWDSYKNKNYKKALEFMPKWVVSFIISIIVAILLLISLPSGLKEKAFILVASTLIFLTRDACILHYFKFSSKNKRASLAAVFYLALLYILLPGILFTIRAKDLAISFYPVLSTDSNIGILANGLIQLIIVAALLLSRIKNENKRLS